MHHDILAQDGQTALVAASMEGHLQVVKVLLEAEAKPDMQTKVLIFVSTQWSACGMNESYSDSACSSNGTLANF